jgi:hypothetical protein
VILSLLAMEASSREACSGHRVLDSIIFLQGLSLVRAKIFKLAKDAVFRHRLFFFFFPSKHCELFFLLFSSAVADSDARNARSCSPTPSHLVCPTAS